jgi:hypothetical protein
MNVILVDTNVKKISMVDVGPKLTLAVAYKLIGCTMIEACHLGKRNDPHAFLCDEEALFKKPLPPALYMDGIANPVYGRLLVVKTTDSGEMTSPDLTVEDVFAMVFFIP